MQHNFTAAACIKGGAAAPNLSGVVKFFQQNDGVTVEVRVSGLPSENKSGFFGFHIHEGKNCGGDNFSDTMGHYNPRELPHPSHAGDLPPLLSCYGSAFMTVKTNRFTVRDIVGRTVVIHGSADDFTTQPSGNSGEKIACGVIRRI